MKDRPLVIRPWQPGKTTGLIAALRARVAELAGEVREWLCDDCNTVYSGPPATGVWCAMCPKCGGATGPKNSIELRRANRRIAELYAALGDKNDALDAALDARDHIEAERDRYREALEFVATSVLCYSLEVATQRARTAINKEP